MIRLMIVEDQVMLRDSLACTINTQSDMEVVASLGDAAEALEALERSGATCALLDVCTENDSSGIVAARKIKEAHPEVKVVIMTGMPEITFVEQARTAGVDSFVYKNVGPPSFWASFARRSRDIPPSPWHSKAFSPTRRSSPIPSLRFCVWCAKRRRAKKLLLSCI